jgi:hypothetical protein
VSTDLNISLAHNIFDGQDLCRSVDSYYVMQTGMHKKELEFTSFEYLLGNIQRAHHCVYQAVYLGPLHPN